MRRIFLLLLTGLFGVVGNQAYAVDFKDGLYVGTNFGAADNLTLCDQISNTYAGRTGLGPTDIFTVTDTSRKNFTLSSPSECKDNDFGLQLFAGWQFMKWIAIEGGWTDLDSTTYIDPDGVGFKSETTGLQINAVGTLPYLEKAGIYFKVGAINWDIDMTQTPLIGNASSSSENGTDFVYGLAFRYPLTDTVGISLEVQRFEDIGNSKTGEMDINLWSAGILLRL